MWWSRATTRPLPPTRTTTGSISAWAGRSDGFSARSPYTMGVIRYAFNSKHGDGAGLRGGLPERRAGPATALPDGRALAGKELHTEPRATAGHCKSRQRAGTLGRLEAGSRL